MTRSSFVLVAIFVLVGCRSKGGASSSSGGGGAPPPRKDAAAPIAPAASSGDPRMGDLRNIPPLVLLDNDKARLEDATNGAVRLSDDGKKLVANQLYRVQVYDVTSGKKEAEIGFPPHKSHNCPGLRKIAISPDGKRLAVLYIHHASPEYILDVIEVATGASLLQASFREQRDLGSGKNPAKGWLDLAFAPGAELLLLWSGPDQKMYAFDVAKKALRWKRALPFRPISAAFRADGGAVAVTHAKSAELVDGGVQTYPNQIGIGVTWIDTNDGAERDTTTLEGGARVLPIAVHPDGKTLAIGIGADVWVGAAGTGAPSSRLSSEGRMISSVAFSADGASLTAMGLMNVGGGEIERWAVATRQRQGRSPMRREPFPPHRVKDPLPIDQTSVSKDGEIVAWGNYYWSNVAKSVDGVPLHRPERENQEYKVDHCVPLK